MIKTLLAVISLLLTGFGVYEYYRPHGKSAIRSTIAKPIAAAKKNTTLLKLKSKAAAVKTYCKAHKLSGEVCFLIDMSLPAGRKRFFVYDLKADTILTSGLVAHGSCNTKFLDSAQFSNTIESGCSSMGKYKIGYPYAGRFGKSYKLYGLDASNANAFQRFVVLHPYSCVPDEETDPEPICNSLGCPMVSYNFMDQLKPFIDNSKKPLLLWIF